MRSRLKPLALLGAVALLLHLVALGGLQWTWAQRPALPAATTVAVATAAAATAPAPPVQLRAVADELAPRVVAAEPAEKVLASVVSPVRRAPLQARASAAPMVAVASAPAPVLEPAPAPALVQPLRVDVPLALNVVAPPASPAPGSAASAAAGGAIKDAPIVALDAPLPHYRTQAPPSTWLRYDLQRGLLRGSGEMLWSQDGARYELRLAGKVGPLAVLTQVSSGGFDAAGLAPLRFTDKRLRRATAAANFQREAGKITFSGPSTEFPLRPGMQDRLSWMVQLAAIVAAEPALRVPGALVLMGVVGANADAGVWAFRCVGREVLDTGAGAIANTLRYQRDPHDLHDTTVQVWLDPQRHYLPIHATQKSGPTDEEFSLRLLESRSPP